MEIWKDEKYLCFLSCVFAMEDKKVEWEKININFICFVKKNKTMENEICLNLLSCSYYIKFNSFYTRYK